MLEWREQLSTATPCMSPLVQSSVGEAHTVIEEALKASAIPRTFILRANYFMQNLLKSGLSSVLSSSYPLSESASPSFTINAFLHVLLKLSNDQPRYTRSEWMGLAPLPGSFAAEDREAAVQMLWAILQNEDAVEGLRGMMEQYAHEGGA